MHVSFWEADSFYNDIDYAIIGSGIVGLSAAIELKKLNPKAKIVILEKGLLPSGASTKNAGFACFGSPTEVLSDLKTMTKEEVFSTVEKRWKGLLNLRSILSDELMDFKNLGSCELFTNQDEEVYNETVGQIDFLNDFLRPIFKEDIYESRDELIEEFGFENVDHIIVNKFEGQIDTGKTLKALIDLARLKGIEIYNGVFVDEVKKEDNACTICTPQFNIKAKKVVIATNGFAKQLLPELDVEPARAQVLITEPIDDLKLKGTFHYEQGYYYFRNIGNRILFGGGRNLAFEEENCSEIKTTELIQNKLDEILYNTIIPYNKEVKIDMRWAGIMGVGQKKTTIVKQIDESIYCAVRMGGMGVAIGSLIGKEIAELININNQVSASN